MPQLFELDEAAVTAAEQKLSETGQAVDREAMNASQMVTSLTGSGWLGGANTVASNKQTGEFEPAMRKLHNEIDFIRDALGLSRQQTVSEDQASEGALAAIPVELGNFGRMMA